MSKFVINRSYNFKHISLNTALVLTSILLTAYATLITFAKEMFFVTAGTILMYWLIGRLGGPQFTYDAVDFWIGVMLSSLFTLVAYCQKFYDANKGT